MKITYFVVFLLLSITILGQPKTEDRSSAIDLFNSGNSKAAIAVLEKYTAKNETDLVGWHYLGMAREKDGDVEGAKSAYLYCINRGVSILEGKVRKVTLEPENLADYDGIKEFLQSTFGEQIEAGYESALAYKRLEPKKAAKIEYETKEAIFATFSKKTYLFASPSDKKSGLFKGIELKRGRRSGSGCCGSRVAAPRRTGIMRITVMFLANGKIGFVIPHGDPMDQYIQEAVEYAKSFEFKPASLDGKAVTTISKLEISTSSSPSFPIWIP